LVVDVGDPVKAFIARGRVDAADSGDCLVSAGAAQGRKYSGMGRVRPFHLRCKTSGTSAVRGQLHVLQLWSCEAVVSSLTSLLAVPCEAVVPCCSSPPAVCGRARQSCLVVAVKFRQLPCEAVVSS